MNRKTRAKQPEKNDNTRHVVPVICIFLLLAVGLVFGRTLRHDFVNYDDPSYVYENRHVADGLSVQGIVWAFTQRHTYNWHPLTWLSHMLDCQVYGLAPWGHHLTNVLLHAATAITLFLVLLRMTGHLWPSALAAAVFAVHPLRVESVAWVSERKDVLSGLFFMLALWAYAGYARRPFSLASAHGVCRVQNNGAAHGVCRVHSTLRYLLVAVFFALGLMAKPMPVTLPFVLLLLDYWPLGRMINVSRTLRVRNRHTECAEDIQPDRHTECAEYIKLILEKVPLLAIAAASCVVTLWAQADAIGANEYIALPWRLGNAAVSYVGYVVHFFCPVGLAVLYPHSGNNLPIWQVATAFLLLILVSGGVIALRKRCPYMLTGWFWYMVMLVPVIGLVQVGLQSMADRYTYLPQIGLCIGVAWGLADLCRIWPNWKPTCVVASVLMLVVLIACAWRQTSFWRNSETLWTHALQCTSKNYVAHGNLGFIMLRQDRVPEAIEQFNDALRLNPEFIAAYVNLASAYAKTNRPAEAIDCAEKGLKFARAKGKTAAARQIEDWLKAYRNSISPPAGNSGLR
jgi:protein O-mannosyl-transferase